MLIFTNGRFFLDGQWKTGFDLIVDGNKIVDIQPEGMGNYGCEMIDAAGGYIAPGFIDIHIHGSHGSDVMDGSLNSLENISAFLACNGTTSYLATTMTYDLDRITKSIKVVSEYMSQKANKGAQIIGVHMEGPFLNPLAKGAHDENFIILPSIEAYNALTAEWGDIVRLVTIAPELEGAYELAEYLKKNNVTASIGHTKACYAKCMEAIGCGFTHTTHFYNAMTPLNHREPGTVGAILDNDAITIELIADLIHVHPAALRLAAQTKGKHRTVLITDAMAAAGLEDGVYELGGLSVYVKDRAARLQDGTLAGSTLTQNQALKNMVSIGLPSEDVITMLTETPARQIGVNHYKGKLEKGYDADIVILDNDLNVIQTFIRGEKQ